jgi:hypothetical protein
MPGLLVRGPVIVMPAAFRVRHIGLEGVRPPVHEEAEVVLRHGSATTSHFRARHATDGERALERQR